MSNMNRLRGLKALIQDVVEHGTTAVERVHMATAARPFEVLDLIPPIAPGARGVRLIHDATVAGVYETIRQVNRLVGVTLSAAIDLYDPGDPKEGDSPAGASDPSASGRPDAAPAVPERDTAFDPERGDVRGA